MKRFAAIAIVLLAGCSGSSGSSPPSGGGGGGATSGPPWLGFANDAQHAAQSAAAAQTLNAIHWRLTIDAAPQYDNGELLAHYGSPVITPGNTVITGVKTNAAGGIQIQARAGGTGAIVWQAPSDYTFPPHQWTPGYNPVLTVLGRLYFPGSGGKLLYRDSPDSAQGAVQTAVFYGAAAYSAAKSAYDAAVAIDTPLTADARGDVFFGFTVNGATPAHLVSGFARVGANGQGTWVSASSAAGDPSITKVAMNAAPALSADQRAVYVPVSNGTNGYLLALDSTSLATKAKVYLNDPASGAPAVIEESGTSSPTVGPDGDVYFGVLESPFASHNDRGWLLHFDAALAHQKIPGSFGWDDTASIVPAAMVPSYSGPSAYLLMTKYNTYGGVGTGNGHNEIAILDPASAQPDPIVPAVGVMKQVETIAGVTRDPNYPGGVREWCINTAAIDQSAGAVFANSEDGYLYRWDLRSNAFTQRIRLTSGIGEAYTPTAVGPDGQVYAINNAVLFAIGQ